ncbi:hypothetical protein [Oceanobacter antarcticus]|uniref:Uncharacterized protein n=1 Tax=Oceanobacter antarcticus TaxID=3133425 RepID=A0ABW8NJR5_9GAMM
MSAPTTAFKTLEIYPRDNTFGSAIAFCPLLIITKDQIDELLGMFGRALAETGRYVEKQGGGLND